ncbi:MAG TPA: universal stress protein [Flavobacteriales bacterium]|nr:universal stress protein [Flavobacteriales bacterium]
MSIVTSRILIPIGFSDQSMIALGQAFNLAKIKKSEIILLSVIEEPNRIESLFLDDRTHELQQKVNDKLVEVGKEYAEKYDIHVETMVAKGRVYEKIIEVAEMVNADLIVMGTNGTPKGVVKKVIGSNAERVVRLAHCPVITIKGKQHKNGCENIILPLDLENRTKEKVTLAIEYARYWGATIRVVSVLLKDRQEIKDKLVRNLNQVKKFISDANIECSSELLEGEKGKGLVSCILDYEKKFESDLILIMTRQEDVFSNKLGTVARKIIYQSDIPVMSIKPHEREDVPSPFTY